MTDEVWVLTGDKAGDNDQAIQLARLLNRRYRVIQLNYNQGYRLPNSLLGASVWTLRGGRAEFQAPWPKLVIGTGRRSVPPALYIKKASGDKTRLIRIGRPRADLRHFELVISTPQYRLPPRPNVLQLPLPLTSRDAATLDKAACASTSKLKKPIVVLIGGNADPYRFDTLAVEDLGKKLRLLARQERRDLWVSYGRRVEPAMAVMLDQALGPALRGSHRFGDGGDNPYATMLAAAEMFVVTADSASMISDAVGRGYPVLLYSPSYRPGLAFLIRSYLENVLQRALGQNRWDEWVAAGVYVPLKRIDLLIEQVLELSNVTVLGGDQCAATYKASGFTAAKLRSRLERELSIKGMKG